jgi:HlyD family secretion protein
MKNKFSQTYNKIKLFIKSHKWISAIIVVIIIFVGFSAVKAMSSTSGETRYVTTTVQKGTVISSVSGSGQVSATDQVDVKAKVSGDITWIGVTAGQTVYAGQALATIDNTNAKASVDDATATLAQSKLQYQKDSASAPLDYQNTLDALASAKVDLSTTFNNTFNTLSNTYLDLPTAVTGAQNILYGNDLSPSSGQWNVDFMVSLFNNKDADKVKINDFATIAEDDYKTARAEYDASLLQYKTLTRTSSVEDIQSLLDNSVDTTTSIAQAVQSELNLLSLISDTATTYNMKLPSVFATMQTNARSYLSTTNSDLSNLLTAQKNIITANQTIKTDQQNITLMQVGNSTDGSDPISLQISQNNLTKQERDLENLKTALYDYTVVAPFDGTVASVSGVVGDTAGTIATIITKQQVAELSLNEVDAAKVSAGQKAVLTFDAISDLSITGTVAEVDSVGTVSQGVVSYTVKITFDVQDARIKPGMTVNASIQTAVHNDVLVVPSSAVKTTNGVSVVQVFDPAISATGGTAGTISATPPKQVEVTVGISDDTNVEILSGVSEGEQVVSRTITGTTKTTTSAATSATTRSAGGFGGAGALRIGG